MDAVFSILKSMLEAGDTLIVAISGGPDSVALLDILTKFSQSSLHAEQKLRLVIAHVNHGIRGREAFRDEEFVRKLAARYGLPFELRRVQLAGRSAQEEEGRRARRKFFEQLRKKYHARFIVTAHTADDQAETIVMNLIRGSGPAGLAGMKMVEGAYFKPFLETPKVEIFSFLKAHKLAFRRDRTNRDTRYTRNFIRKKILPLMEKINPSLAATLSENAKIFRVLEDELEQKAEAFLKPRSPLKRRSPRERLATVPRRAFLALSEALQNAVIQLMFRRGTRQPYRLSAAKVQAVRRLLERNIGKKRIETGGGTAFVLEKGTVRFTRKFDF